MPKPRYVRDAHREVAVLLRDFEPTQQGFAEKIHALVLRQFDSSDSRLFAIVGYELDIEARVALTFLFRRTHLLLVEVGWMARYLYATESDIRLYEKTAVHVLSAAPDGVFSRNIKYICTLCALSLDVMMEDD